MQHQGDDTLFEAIDLLPTGRSNSNNNSYGSNLLVGNNDLFDHSRALDHFYERSTLKRITNLLMLNSSYILNNHSSVF